MRKFTKILFNLVVEKGLNLKQSLELIKQGNKSTLGKTSSFILENILQGMDLSSAMKKCPYMDFDDIYIKFIKFGEITGRINETIDFLYKRCERKNENLNKLIESLVYPGIIIVFSISLFIYLLVSNYFQIGNEIYLCSILLMILSGIILFVIYRLIGENKLYEAFLSISFLIEGGINIYDSIGLGAQMLGVTSKLGIKFQRARENLMLGMGLEKSFSLGDKYKDAFYYGEKSGGKNDIFKKIATYIEEKNERKRKLCFRLMEPVFILLVGLFLLIIVVFVFLPNITNINLL